ncbi:MAG TPA: hypothetical protein PKA13_06540 [Geminicoccaceae bacterium]|nr:hypothetical protein [Geminicoccus sp.]HMU49415.1 hypothetical protein [Geminicoccaceae bacterium]
MIRKLMMLGIVAAAAALMATTPARADEQSAGCHAPKEIARLLSTDFSEKPVAYGLQQDGTLMQIFASKTGETWTVVLTTPAGLSCIVAEGIRWENLPAGPDGPYV